MSVCEHCGAIRTERAERAERYGIVVLTDPLEATYAGKCLRLSVTNLRLLRELVANEWVAHATLQQIASPASGWPQLEVLRRLRQLRRTLLAAGADVRISNIYMQGYRLERAEG